MNYNYLPDKYQLKREIDFKVDKKLTLIINLSSCIILTLMFLTALFFIPLALELNSAIFYFIILFGFMIVYIALKELIHGLFIKLFLKEKLKFGLVIRHGFIRCEKGFFDKKSYVIMTLSPIVFPGIILSILNLIFPQWFWFIYFIQMLNISGAAFDLYTAAAILKMSDNVLVNYTGVNMKFYISANKNK